MKTITELFDFIGKSPTAFHAVNSIKNILESHGFKRLCEEDMWHVEAGGKYYVTRNNSSIVAVDVGEGVTAGGNRSAGGETSASGTHSASGKTFASEAACGGYSFHITASHSDSPAFKIKEKPLLQVMGKYTQLNTEGYGGMLCAPWLDRPLSIAGRVIVKVGEKFESRLVCFNRDLVLIPNVAIHMNRNVNDGFSYNNQIDMLPLLCGGGFTEDDFYQMVADEVGEDLGEKIDASQIYGTDLFLYNRTAPSVWGAKSEFISAPRLDDLQCAFACLMGFVSASSSANGSQSAGGGASANAGVNVYVCLDNEEVGSGTKQGAASTFVADVLRRINDALGKNDEDFHRALATSFMLSCDNAHAVHPNHPEKTDAANHAFINEGIVIKSHAGQKYTSDAVSIAAFKEVCKRANVPFQFFANRSDAVGGSTLGNISMTQLSLNCVDIGLPQLAMHSPYETAGVKDTEYMIRAVTEFYQSRFSVSGDGFDI